MFRIKYLFRKISGVPLMERRPYFFRQTNWNLEHYGIKVSHFVLFWSKLVFLCGTGVVDIAKRISPQGNVDMLVRHSWNHHLDQNFAPARKTRGCILFPSFIIVQILKHEASEPEQRNVFKSVSHSVIIEECKVFVSVKHIDILKVLKCVGGLKFATGIWKQYQNLRIY